MNRLAITLASWFGCGFASIAPGTAGSAGAIICAIAAIHWLGFAPWHFAVAAAVLLLPAVWAADVTARVRQAKDPGLVVVDEVAGQWLTLTGARVLDWQHLLAAFLIFRALDVWKPFPARQLEALPGGAGIVADDIMAGAYGALVLWLAGWFNF
jgi:phosphatidylglycerophosphatase A